MTVLSAASLALAAALLCLPYSSRHRLLAAGLLPRRRATAHRFRGAVWCAAAVVAFAAAVVPISVMLAAALTGATLLLRGRRRVARRRAEADSGALETALDVLVSELRAGAHPVAAFQVAADEAAGAVGEAFRAVAARAMLGADVPAGLRSAATASARPMYWQRLAVCWDLAQRHGLTMASLMRTAQRDIVERSRFDARVSAGMAGARATATVLACLPLGGVALGELIGAQPLRFPGRRHRRRLASARGRCSCVLRPAVVGPHHRSGAGVTLSAVLLAAALLLGPGPAIVRRRAGATPRRAARQTEDHTTADPLAVAASLDVLAVCLKAGMAVSAAAGATAPTAPVGLAAVLRRAADLLALGAEPSAAWSAPNGDSDPHCESLLRMARRSASSGAALADGVAELAASVRHDAADAARAAAERASVLIAGPLGLCYLPAFVCLGIVPVVAGLAREVLSSGLL